MKAGWMADLTVDPMGLNLAWQTVEKSADEKAGLTAPKWADLTAATMAEN